MENAHDVRTSSENSRTSSDTSLLLGLAGGLALLAGLSMLRTKRRRYGDHGEERRRPANMYLAGNYPRRRSIDRSGRQPLFERRQSAYEAD